MRCTTAAGAGPAGPPGPFPSAWQVAWRRAVVEFVVPGRGDRRAALRVTGSGGRLIQLSQNLLGGPAKGTTPGEHQQHRDQPPPEGRRPTVDGDLDVAAGVGRLDPVE